VLGPAQLDRPPSPVAWAPTPTPLSIRQLSVTLQAVARELTWTLPSVAHEVRRWRKLAACAPEPAIRSDALSSFAYKRVNIDGAALFCILTPSRNLRLLRLIAAYQILWDFLDSMNERGADCGTINGQRLHLALVEALDPAQSISDYYRYHPWRGDGGYLHSLVLFCRREAGSLPRYDTVRRLVVREASHAKVLAINHTLDPVQRERELRHWARRAFPTEQRASWFEISAAASAGLTIFALLTATAKPGITAAELEQIRGAYSPWISATATMLDSYVDQGEDEKNGEHSYVSHYPTTLTARCLGGLVHRATLEAASLSDGVRHVLIVASMTAMYLTNDRVRTARTRKEVRPVVRGGGSLVAVLLPILRLWRVLYAQCSS